MIYGLNEDIVKDRGPRRLRINSRSSNPMTLILETNSSNRICRNTNMSGRIRCKLDNAIPEAISFKKQDGRRKSTSPRQEHVQPTPTIQLPSLRRLRILGKTHVANVGNNVYQCRSDRIADVRNTPSLISP